MDNIEGNGYTCTFKGYNTVGDPKYACRCHATGVIYNFTLMAGWSVTQCAEFIASQIKYDCPPTAKPKGKIVGFWCNGYPECQLTANPGEIIEMEARMQNTGSALGEFRFKIIEDATGKVLAKYPEVTYKNVAAGEIWHAKSGFVDKLNFKAPLTTSKFRLELWRQQ